MKRPSDKGNNLNRSLEKENSKPKQKIINQAERKKMEEEEAKILQKQAEDEQLKQRQAELKKRM